MNLNTFIQWNMIREHLLQSIDIIIILSCHQHGYPWPSLATSPYRSSHPAGTQSCTPYPQRAVVRAGHTDFLRPCERVHMSTSLMSSFLLLQQCPAYLVRLTWIVFVMGGRWPYNWCFVECCLLEPVQYCSQHYCVVAVKLFLHPFS